MTRLVTTRSPSFPDAPPDAPIGPFPPARWQVLCGDAGRWRVGLYSPDLSSAGQVTELERHDCPEFFWLVSGRLTLVLADGAGGVREVPLSPGRPVLVRAPHSGYCPDGPHTGVALVIERDEFTTEYRAIEEWGRDA